MFDVNQLSSAMYAGEALRNGEHLVFGKGQFRAPDVKAPSMHTTLSAIRR